MACQIIPFPEDLRPRLPTIVGNVDYQSLRQNLEQIDGLLRQSGVEESFVNQALEAWMGRCRRSASALEQGRYQQRSRRALRCSVLRALLQEDYRGLSCQLAGNPLYQWFCQIDAIDQIRVPSKSELQRFAHWLPAEQMNSLVYQLLRGGVEKPGKLRLKEAVNLDECFLDSSCVKANMHFPVDWVLLRDGVRTLLKATTLIRRAGLKGRMEAPEQFLRRMNRLSLEMTQQARRSGHKKGRKRVLRAMKRLVGVVRGHARRHRQLLDQQWERTDWSRRQVEQILRRIDGVLELLPRAQKQAHERIIGARPVANAEKILSLYEREARVIVRGKAGAEVEFGNTMVLGENRQGLIVDWKLLAEQAPPDSQLLMESLLRVWEGVGQRVGSVVTDRGFHSAANSQALKAGGTYDGTCPRAPKKLKARMRSKQFAQLQRRRGQTEARISILKRNFLGCPLRAKGFVHRELALIWGVLTHNLWVMARMRKRRNRSRASNQKAA